MIYPFFCNFLSIAVFPLSASEIKHEIKLRSLFVHVRIRL